MTAPPAAEIVAQAQKLRDNMCDGCSRGATPRHGVCDLYYEAASTIERLAKQDEVHWKTRRTLLAERDALRTTLEHQQASHDALLADWQRLISESAALRTTEAELRAALDDIATMSDMARRAGGDRTVLQDRLSEIYWRVEQARSAFHKTGTSAAAGEKDGN